MMKSSLHSEEDDFVPELQRSIHPRERPDWEETLSAMARGADIPDITGELPLRTCGSTASMKVKNVKKYINPGLMGCDAFHRLSFTKGHFPKMAECAHFHYENVDFGNIQLSLPEEQSEVMRNGCESKELVYLVQISCQGKSWIVKRSYEDFRVLDKHLHLCIYDRRFSQLAELPRSDVLRDSPELVTHTLMAYLSRLSAIACNKINCGPALTWMEIDNKGNHLLVHEESSINIPAIAAAHVIKRYIAQAPDELSFEVGDIVSVIDMPPKELTTWWRGKHGFQVGFFPSECVELINDKVPQSVTNSVPKPVSKKHGKLITFLRSFMKSRPTKQKLKQRGILKERVFGCDLGEHLLNSGQDVPQVLKSCTEFIEKHGIVDGIYRLSGVASNIQKLRHEFDSEQIPDLTKDNYIHDIHSVSSLCKMYFRELPNPLLTYQLYEKFSDAVSAATDEERLVRIHDVIQQLPPPHYRTLEYLMRHLARLADYCTITNMHAKNLAIVWAPNLLRSKQIESACFSGTAAFMEVRIQSVVVEFILNHTDVLFSSKFSSVIRDGAGHSSLSRPKSLLVSSPSTKLLTLEEAQARTQGQINSPMVTDNRYIEVGEGPAALQGKFHTVIDFPSERKRPPSKMKKSPVGSWRSFFNLGKSSSVSKRKLQRNPSEPSEMKVIALAGGRGDSGTLRSAKSEESLTSLHAVDGESNRFRPRRPRSSSDALSASFNGELLGSMNRCNSYDNLPHDNSDGDKELIHVPALISPRSAEDVDLSPPDIGVASLDFDPMSFQCSPPQTESDCPDSSTSMLESIGISKEKPSLLKKDLESGSQSQTPGSATSSEPVSPFQEKMSPFFTLDLSPTEEKTFKPSDTSPQMGKKPIKSPPLTTSEPVSFALPSCTSESIGGMLITTRNSSTSNWSEEIGIAEITNRFPTQMSLPLKETERAAEEEAHQELKHAQIVAAGKPELPDEGERPMSSSQNKTVPSGHAQPGAVALDSPQDPVPVSSVSLIPPPPPKNAARMLALALAESAQQASAQSQKKPGDAHSESTTYGENEAATALEKLHLSAGAPDKLHLYTDLPENQLHFQTSAPVEQDFQASSTAQEQNHSPGAPGSQDPQPLHTSVPGDVPARRDAEQEQPSYLAGQMENKEQFPAPAEDWEQTRQHAPGALPDWEPPTTDLPMDKPHVHACTSGDKQLTSTCSADDKLETPVTAGEKSTPVPVPYLTTIQTAAAEPNRAPTCQHAAGPALIQADGTGTAAQRTPTGSQPTPPQRQDHQSAVGQVPAASAKASSNSSQVWGAAAPEKPPEPTPGFATESTSSSHRSSSVPSSHQSRLEKPREGTRAPLLHLRSESVPTHSSYGFTPPVPPVRTLESKIAAAMHSNNTDAINNSNYHAFLASSMLASSVEEVLLPPPAPPPPPLPPPPLAPPPPPKHTSLQSMYVPHPKPESILEPSGPDVYLHHKPTSIHQYRPESVPPHVSYHSKPDQHPAYPPRSETPTSASARYNTYTNQGRSSSVVYSKPRSRMEFASSVSPTGLRNATYAEDPPPYPTIRRVQSLHVPTPAASAIRSVPISRTEVPPDDEPLFCPRPLYQYKPYQPHSDYHVTQLQPYFENGRVHYRYSPYSSSSGSSYYTSADGNFYDLDPYSTMRVRPFHPLHSRDFTSYEARLHSKGLHRYPGLSAYPRGGLIGHLAGKEHSFISRDVPPAPDIKHMYMSWDLEDMEKYRMQSIRRESRTRQKVKGPLMSQYDNVTPLLPEDPGGPDIIHLRSKSDPGKSGLLTVAEGKEGKYPAKAATPDGEERYYMQHPEPELDRAHYHGAYRNGQPEKPSLPQKQSSIRSRKLHEPTCGASDHRPHLQQEPSHRQPSEPKNGPPYPDYRPKGAEPAEPMGYQHLGRKYILANQDTMRLNHKEVRLAEDRPDLERSRARPSTSIEKHPRDGYKEEEHAASPMAPPPSPERSHSLRVQHRESVEKDSALFYPYQTLGKRQSTMTVMSQYDNVEDYHTMPQHQRGGYAGEGGCVPPAFTHVHSRIYATALGQGAFLPTELCLQRPETEVHVE
ncbi:rho GTPase-activating protein 32 isoform X1 [Lagopus muta]|uniref:rho GTPase-activating protein 32 isoform X1 n=2 Tax=Lagopus muta TaxID=64668 RepID=UPI00209E54F7|nr:rho GTPase-activating protein 32 isoform X1 [Lagopus muta]XP_048824583.1 rho GTPase-activating protein 32 isoform X1 [Lagopus muta]XP_048824584.1 rho GTPase-activating protein 32 isoform X1 [Lagopus muta]XP_048824585.1 rho GTPase-activating protein 32 isoform X1 [Lagopus muta]XP_048824587.1 rho GTPase-activating protein 32 isoform X1 [Lagopus muta]